MNDMWKILSNVKKSFSDEDKTDNDNEKEENLINKNKICENCGGYNLEKINNEKIECVDCGLVKDSIIDYTQEWRYYGANDNKRSADPNRCGMPLNPLFKSSSLCTVLIGNKCRKFKKMNDWNGLSYKERRLIHILNKISKKAKMSHIPSCVVDRAIVMFKKISENQIKRGESLESIIASCLRLSVKYYSNIDSEVTRCNNEIAKLFGLEEKKLSKGCNQSFEIMFKKDPKFLKKIKPTEPKDLITRFSSILKLDEKYKLLAIKASILADKLGICQDNNPKSIAVGTIYLISQLYKLGYTKKNISKLCGTSEVTISHTYTQLYRFRKYIIHEG